MKLKDLIQQIIDHLRGKKKTEVVSGAKPFPEPDPIEPKDEIEEEPKVEVKPEESPKEEKPKPKHKVEPKCLLDLIEPKDESRVKYYNHKKDLSKWWYFCGYYPCNATRENLFNIIDVIAASIVEDFPERNDSRLSIGDGCPYPWTTRTKNHPQHVGGWCIDFNYYTFGEDNITQYVPPWREPKEVRVWYKRVTPLWEDPMRAKIFLPYNFDIDRNLEFFLRVLDVLPGSKILLNNKIHQLFRWMIPEERIKNFYPDNSPGLFHQTHSHITFGNGDVLGGRDILWEKELTWLPKTF